MAKKLDAGQTAYVSPHQVLFFSFRFYFFCYFFFTYWLNTCIRTVDIGTVRLQACDLKCFFFLNA